MKAEDVIRQLYAVLPKYTDKFTDNFSVSSLTRSGTTVTVVTTAAHSLSTGDYAFIVGAKNPISISSLGQSGGVASVETSEDHNLSISLLELRLKRLPTIEIAGANESDYNGEHELLSVSNRRNFTYKIDDAAPATATGTPVLLQDGIGYNGLHEITVIDPTTFTYQTTETPNSPAQGTIEARVRTRISGSVAGEAAVEAYTAQSPDKLWGFVVIGDKVANKSREVMSDAINTPGEGEEYRQLVIQPFSVFCIFPATGSIDARQERDAADDLVLPFCKSLLRVKFPTGFFEESFAGTVFSTDRFFLYDKAIYVHEYSFQTTGWMVYEDTVDPEESVAFRDINLSFETTLSETAGIVMTAKVDLDEEQLT